MNNTAATKTTATECPWPSTFHLVQNGRCTRCGAVEVTAADNTVTPADVQTTAAANLQKVLGIAREASAAGETEVTEAIYADCTLQELIRGEHPYHITDAEALMLAADMSGSAERATFAAVYRARKAGMSWADVAAPLGVTRQGAQQRWAEQISHHDAYLLAIQQAAETPHPTAVDILNTAEVDHLD